MSTFGITVANSALIGVVIGYNLLQGIFSVRAFRSHGDRARSGVHWVRACMILNTIAGTLWLATYRTYNILLFAEEPSQGSMSRSAHVHAVANLFLGLAVSVMIATQFELGQSLRLVMASHDDIDEKNAPVVRRRYSDSVAHVVSWCLMGVALLLCIGCFVSAEIAIANVEPSVAVDMFKERVLVFEDDLSEEQLSRAGLKSLKAFYGMDFGLNMLLSLLAVDSFVGARWINKQGPEELRHSCLPIMGFLTLIRQTYQILYSGIFRLGPLAGTTTLEPPLWIDILSTLFTLWTLTFCTAIGFALMKQRDGGLWLDSSPPEAEEKKESKKTIFWRLVYPFTQFFSFLLP